MTSLQTFELFPRLPSELRELVWEAAMPPSRLVHLQKGLLKDVYTLRQREEIQYREDRYGNEKDMYGADILPSADRNLSLLLHRRDRGSDGRLKEVQTQLDKYGFISSRLTPIIRHVFQEVLSYECLDQKEACPAVLNRDVCILQHSCGNLTQRLGRIQTQLNEYGFTAFQPHPSLRHMALERMRWELQPKWPRLFSTLSPQALLRTCKESRRLMQLRGYQLAFSTRCAPALTWFNPHTDFLYHTQGNMDPTLDTQGRLIGEEFGLIRDVKLVRKLALKFPDRLFYEYEEACPIFTEEVSQMFGNLEELVILMGDNREDTDAPCAQIREPSLFSSPTSQSEVSWYDDHRIPPRPREDDWLFVDYDESQAAVGGCRPMWNHRPHPFRTEIRAHDRTYPDGPPFYQFIAKQYEQRLTEQRDAAVLSGARGWEIPKIRFALLTTTKGARKMRILRTRFFWKLQYKYLVEEATCPNSKYTWGPVDGPDD